MHIAGDQKIRNIVMKNNVSTIDSNAKMDKNSNIKVNVKVTQSLFSKMGKKCIFHFI